jgi:hypothetical protein
MRRTEKEPCGDGWFEFCPALFVFVRKYRIEILRVPLRTLGREVPDV